MPIGAFRVYREPENPRDIRFENVEKDVPEEQLLLKEEVEQTLIVLRGIFSEGDPRFENYFKPLLSLAQLGLVGDSANPAVASRALATLKADVTAGEGARVKNKYMKSLGAKALLLGVPALFVAGALLWFFPQSKVLANFMVLWSGCMAGVWLSFGARKATFRFEDLHMPEQDRLEPIVRLCFAGLLTIVIGLLFSTEAVAVTLGSIKSSQINDSFRVALLIGMFCGVSEQALSSKVAKQASSFLDAGK